MFWMKFKKCYMDGLEWAIEFVIIWRCKYLIWSENETIYSWSGKKMKCFNFVEGLDRMKWKAIWWRVWYEIDEMLYRRFEMKIDELLYSYVLTE